MAQLNDLIVTGKSRFLNSISGNITGTASNVTGTVAIANGGTGATTRLGAAQALTNEAVATPGYIVGLTSNWAKFGYTSMDQLKTTLGLGSNAYTSTAYLPLAGGTMTGQLFLSASGLKVNNVAGYSIDQYGNITHLRNTSSDTLEIKNNAGSAKLKVAYESGDVTMSGTIITPADDSKGLEPATRGYGTIGKSDKYYCSSFIDTMYGTALRIAKEWNTLDNSYIQINTNDINLYGTNNTWDGTNRYLKTALASVVTYKDFTCTSASVPANASKEFATVNVAKTGYTPIGYLKYNTGNANIVVVNQYLEGNNAILVCKNVSSSAITVGPTFRILYMKTTS